MSESRLYDADGIDGHFNRAMDRAMRDDAKKAQRPAGCRCRVLVHHIPKGRPAEILMCPLHHAAPELAASLRKTLAAAVELHAQNIGCPDCPPEARELIPECPMLRAAEEALDKAGALGVRTAATGGPAEPGKNERGFGRGA